MRPTLAAIVVVTTMSFPALAQTDEARDDMRDQMLTCRIAQADMDGDGALSEDEMRARRDEMRAQVDADGDGEISRDERRDARQMRRDADNACSPESMRFGMVDTDGDGVVSLDEFVAQSERNFERMDENEDGVLQMDELKVPRRGERRRSMRHGRRGQ